MLISAGEGLDGKKEGGFLQGGCDASGGAGGHQGLRQGGCLK